MSKDYSKLKKIYHDDPQMLKSLALEEQTELLREIASKKTTLEGVETIKGDKGDTPTDEELIALIKPLIPEPVKGTDGIDGINPTKEELLVLIRPLIPKVQDGETPSDERLLSLIKPLIPEPITPKDGVDGINPDPKDVIDLLKTLPEKDKLSLSDLRNSTELLAAVGKMKNYDKDGFRFDGRKIKFEELLHGGGSSSGGGGTPAAPVNSIQYNHPLGTFAGDAGFIRDITDPTLRYGMNIAPVSGASEANWNSYIGIPYASLTADQQINARYAHNFMASEIVDSDQLATLHVFSTATSATPAQVTGLITTAYTTIETGTLGFILSSVGQVAIYGEGTVDTGVAFESNFNVTDGGTMGIGIGFHATGSAISEGGSLSQWTGFYAEDNQTATDNNIAYYTAQNTGSNGGFAYISDGTAPSYFMGKFGLGLNTPTAKLHIAGGTATAGTAPQKFTSGTLLGTPEVGAVEFLTDAWYGTITTGTARKTFAFLESPAFTGTPTAPTASIGTNTTQLATTAFVQTAVLTVPGKDAVKYASIAALPSIVYANGASGVGATLTGVALAAISLDGASPGVGDRVLIKDQVSTFQNGIYIVTQTGSGIAVFILTRATDFDQSQDVQTGANTYVLSGSTLSGSTWAVNSASSPVMGTDAITFVREASNALIIGTTPISSGTTTRILYDNAGVLGEYTINGSGTEVAMVAGATFTGATMIDKTNVVEEMTTVASSATPTPTGGSLRNFFSVTALAAGATFAAPSGTPANNNVLTIRILDNGTARTLAWNGIYRVGTISLPTTTTLSKTMYLNFRYNSASSTWDFVAYNDNF